MELQKGKGAAAAAAAASGAAGGGGGGAGAGAPGGGRLLLSTSLDAKDELEEVGVGGGKGVKKLGFGGILERIPGGGDEGGRGRRLSSFFLKQHKHCSSFLLLKEEVWANFLDRLS